MATSSATDVAHLSQYTNCRILRNGSIFREDLWARGGKIIDPRSLFYDEKIIADQKIDCHDAIISPGFIDIQLNGGFGHDFSSGLDVDNAISSVARGILAHGVTSFCPTVITSSPDLYRKVLPNIKKCEGSMEGAGVTGIHIEGPFISTEKSGCHPPQFISDFDNGFSDILATYGDLTNVAIVTLAPEKENSQAVIEELCKRGITVSIGHSAANLIEGEAAIKSGARCITHLFNAMAPFHHRDPHLVGLLTSDKLAESSTVFFGLIADGIHTHPAALRIAQRVNPEGVILVTDAVRAMGLPDGKYQFGEKTIVVHGHESYIEGTRTLAGGTAAMDVCVRNFAKQTRCGAVLALEAASLHPARLLGLDHRKGTLNFGADADFVLLDDGLNVKATYIAGECVYNAPHF